MGEYPAAARAYEEALPNFRQIGNRGGEAEALNNKGVLHRVSGDPALGEQCHRQALELARTTNGTWDEAHALAGLGRCALAAGRTAEAADMLRQALAIFQRLGSAEAAGVSAEISALPVTGTGAPRHETG